MEYYHDAQISKDAVLNLFSLGYCIHLRKTAAWLSESSSAICSKVLAIIRNMDYVPDEFEGLEAMLSGHLLLQLFHFPIDARLLGH